jgi:DHA2 family multidrug resistance protein
MGNATSIFNLMRNIGASIGISTVETMQVRRAQTHINILGEHVNAANPVARQTIAGLRALFMSQGKDAATATRQAYGAVWAMVQQQAAMLSYNDTFRLLAGMFLLMLPLLLLMRKPKKAGGAVMVH